eukprot:g46696.t1
MSMSYLRPNYTWKDSSQPYRMNVIRNSNTLVWDAEKGLALTKGVSYNAGALVINEAGNYLIYSKVFFRGQECTSDISLEHTVFKRTKLYPKDIQLM